MSEAREPEKAQVLKLGFLSAALVAVLVAMWCLRRVATREPETPADVAERPVPADRLDQPASTGRPDRPRAPINVRAPRENSPEGLWVCEDADGRLWSWQGEWLRFLRLDHRCEAWGAHMGAELRLLHSFHRRTAIPRRYHIECDRALRLREPSGEGMPPLAFLAGRGEITMNAREVMILREYLLNRNGMLFVDNRGGAFDESLRRLIRMVLPDAQWLDIPNDDEIYTCWYVLPSGAPPLQQHSGTRALGIRHEGRWVVFYHQGGLGDAWQDGHPAGLEESAELAYQVGVNVIFYCLLRQPQYWKREESMPVLGGTKRPDGKARPAISPSGGYDPDARFRFFRLRYGTRGWDHNLAAGADGNMIREFHRRTRVPVVPEPACIKIAELADLLPLTESPPFVYLTGDGPLSVSDGEAAILRDYVLNRCGLVLADNGGGTFHQAFQALMERVLPAGKWVDIPDHDEVYRCYYILPSGAPPLGHHSGTRALGIKHEDRWVVFYHQGGLGDAWKEGRRRASREDTELVCQLGVNVMHYSLTKRLDFIASLGKRPDRKVRPRQGPSAAGDDLPDELRKDLKDGSLVSE